MNSFVDSVFKDAAAKLRSRFDSSRLKYAELSGIGQSMRQRRDELTQKVSLAKARIEMAPAVAELFERLQERAHQKSVGVFENLLTAILQDVFPEKGSVKLTLTTERSAPALDIRIENDGVEEDIMDGNGGAVTNVVVAGLRYAARSRTDTRALMALDEPDCWIKPDRIPAFMKVISDVARQTGTQTLLISHHNAEYFEGDVAITRMERNADGKVQAVALEPRPPAWTNDTDPGLRWMELINVRAHEQTLIHLSPGVNALIGDNDLGKSTAFISAPRAMAYGDSDDSIIRHGQDFAKIRMGVENGYVVEWTRKRKGSPKVTYALYQNDVLLHEGKPESRGGIPSFVADILRINRVDDLDIQLLGQKQPIFLLNETPARRAQLLSAGRESGFLHALIEKQREWMRRDRETIREGETELMRLHRRLMALEDLQGMASVLDMMTKLIADVESTESAEKSVRLLVQKLEGYSRDVESYSRRVEVLSRVPAALPELYVLPPLQKLIERLHAAGRSDGLSFVATVPEVPALQQNQPIIEVGRRLAALLKIMEAAEHLPEPPESAPDIAKNEVVNLGKLTATLERLVAEDARIENESVQVQGRLSTAEAELEALKDEIGGVCPLCDSAFDGHAH